MMRWARRASRSCQKKSKFSLLWLVIHEPHSRYPPFIALSRLRTVATLTLRPYSLIGKYDELLKLLRPQNYVPFISCNSQIEGIPLLLCLCSVYAIHSKIFKDSLSYPAVSRETQVGLRQLIGAVYTFLNMQGSKFKVKLPIL